MSIENNENIFQNFNKDVPMATKRYVLGDLNKVRVQPPRNAKIKNTTSNNIIMQENNNNYNYNYDNNYNIINNNNNNNNNNNYIMKNNKINNILVDNNNINNNNYFNNNNNIKYNNNNNNNKIIIYEDNNMEIDKINNNNNDNNIIINNNNNNNDNIMEIDKNNYNNNNNNYNNKGIDLEEEMKIIKRKIREKNNYNDYIRLIYFNIRSNELKYLPRDGYMLKQTELTYSMRSILIDWLVEVAEEYNLNNETLFLAINYIDRFLSLMSVVKGKLQLLGATAMFIAAKYEEIYPPEVGEFAYITDDTYTVQQVIQMEKLILKTLDFSVATPTPYYFANEIISIILINYDINNYNNNTTTNDNNDNNCIDDDISLQWRNMTSYLLELILLEGCDFFRFNYSLLSTSAIFISYKFFYMNNNYNILEILIKETGYDEKNIIICASYILPVYKAANQLEQQAIRTKYLDKKRKCVASLDLPDSLKEKL